MELKDEDREYIRRLPQTTKRFQHFQQKQKHWRME